MGVLWSLSSWKGGKDLSQDPREYPLPPRESGRKEQGGRGSWAEGRLALAEVGARGGSWGAMVRSNPRTYSF